MTRKEFQNLSPGDLIVYHGMVFKVVSTSPSTGRSIQVQRVSDDGTVSSTINYFASYTNPALYKQPRLKKVTYQ